MKRNFIIIFIFFILYGNIYSQDNSRYKSIENQLELLKVDVPGLDQILNINISQTTLSNFLLAISKVHSLNINVSPELNSIGIVNNFSNVTVENVFLFLVKEYNLDIDFTGNILSISKYVEPPKIQKEKEISAEYNLSTSNLSLDLKNDKLDKVFRKIMDISGKNLLYSPEIETNPLSIYIKNIPFDIALEKLAESNNLLLTKTNDGFYVFESALIIEENGKNGSSVNRVMRKRKDNFNYQILDTISRRLTVDFQNVPISDIVYSIGDDLGLNLFTASPLDSAGTTTVTSDDITFDLLLDKIFESVILSGSIGGGNSAKGGSNFTYKKNGDIYYFGTESQLSLKQTELITMMYRSVQLLSNPSGNGQRKAGRNNFNTGGNPNTNLNQNYGSSNTSNSGIGSNNTSIVDLIPTDIKDGLELKIDTELNSIIVSGPGVKVERFKNFITYIDKPVPMILIEVMILEVNRSAIVETGVSFGLGEKPSPTIGSVFPSADLRIGAKDVNKIIGNFNGFGSLNLGKVLPEFYLDIKAMESNGNIKVLSTPKLSTINGHKAYLSSGVTSYYAVTTQNFIGSQIPINSEITNYFPIDAELALEISPYVSGDGEVTLDIQVIQSTFNGERIAEDAPPGINSREFSSIIRMRDQDVAILGGIEEVRKDDSGSGVPLLARIPVIKYLFSKRRREATNRKLNILIKPTVIY